MANQGNLNEHKFQKNDPKTGKKDPRINRKGRPKSFDALRSLAQQIAHEKAKSGSKVVIIDNHAVTVAEAILRSWAMGKDKRKQQAFMEIAFGKVPSPVEISGKDGEDVKVTIYIPDNKRD